MRIITALTLGLGVILADAATAETRILPLIQLTYEVADSTDDECAGECANVEFDRDHSRVGLSGGLLWMWSRVGVGATLDKDYFSGPTLRARYQITDRLSVGLGIGARDYSSDPDNAGARAWISNERAWADYADVSVQYGIFLLRWAHLEAQFDHTYREYVGATPPADPYGPAQPFERDLTINSLWLGVSTPF